MQKQKRLLITGAAGTVGSALIEQALNRRDEFTLTVFDLDTKNNRRKLEKYRRDLTILYGDIRNPDDTDIACQNQDAVIHLAALIPPASERDTLLAYQVNVAGTQHIIRSLETFSPGAFLCYASSISVYGDRLENPEIQVGDPVNSGFYDYYAQTKIEAETLIRQSRLDWTIFRLTAIMGVNNHKVSPIMFHMPLETPIEIATPEDTARAFLEAVNNKSQLMEKIFNLSGGSFCRTTYKQFLNRSFTLFGLGKLNFPANAFAKRNFHCGYYMDGDDLEAILHFRRDTLESYFRRVKRGIPGIRRFFTNLFSPAIKQALLNRSEPRNALRHQDKDLIVRFFGALTKNRMVPSAK